MCNNSFLSTQKDIRLWILGVKYTEVGLTEAGSVWSTEMAHIWVPGPLLPPAACDSPSVLHRLLLLLEEQCKHKILLNLIIKHCETM